MLASIALNKPNSVEKSQRHNSATATPDNTEGK
jgi:hypothetical protein